MVSFKNLLIFLLAIPTLVFGSNEEEKKFTQVVRDQILQHIEISGKVYVQIEAGNTETVTLESKSEETLKSVDAQTIGQTFFINGPKRKDPEADVYVTIVTSSLKTLTVKGSARVSSKGFLAYNILDVHNKGSGSLRLDFAGNVLNLVQTGSGETYLNIAANVLDVTLKGSGNIKAFGEIKHQEVSLMGSGNYYASQLRSESGEVKSKGSGDVEVDAEKKLIIKHSGSGDVTYFGHPRIVKEGWGSGTIKRKS